jgi:hypothetical protein
MRIAVALGHDMIQLDTTSACSSTPLQDAARPDRYTSPPHRSCRPFGIKTSEIDPAADILTMRPGLSSLSKMQLTYCLLFQPKSRSFLATAALPAGLAVAPRAAMGKKHSPARRTAASPTP